MNWFREIGRRLWTFIHRNQFDTDLQEEMRLHRELREQEEMERGLSPEEAHYAAARRFGNDLLLREKSHDVWGWNWLEEAMHDVRFGLRQLRKSPGFTAVAVITLTFGIGVNTTIFSLVNTVVLHPLPYPHAERLVGIESRRAASVYAEVQEGIQKQSRTFDAFGACSFDPLNVTLIGTGRRRACERWMFLRMLSRCSAFPLCWDEPSCPRKTYRVAARLWY